jgi:hypothetical protein
MTNEQKIELYNKLWTLSIAELEKFVREEKDFDVKDYAFNELMARKQRMDDKKNNRW